MTTRRDAIRDALYAVSLDFAESEAFAEVAEQAVTEWEAAPRDPGTVEDNPRVNDARLEMLDQLYRAVNGHEPVARPDAPGFVWHELLVTVRKWRGEEPMTGEPSELERIAAQNAVPITSTPSSVFPALHEAVAIVRDLAAADPTYWTAWGETTTCTLCGAEGSGTLGEPHPHDCIFLRARVWVSENPPTGDTEK